ncbi:MAG: DUF4136 domain-containing protein [bacterium]
MKIGRYVVIAALAAIVGGCGTSKEVKRVMDSPIVVETQVADGVDFSNYQTWSWLPLPASTELDSRIDNPEFKGNMNDAVEREMYTRGYKRDQAAPDLLVNGHAVFMEIDQAYIDEHYNGSYYPEYHMQMADDAKPKKKWQEGTVVLFVFDSQTRQLVYEASAQAEITDPKYTTPEQRKDRIDQAVAKMMADFPRR